MAASLRLLSTPTPPASPADGELLASFLEGGEEAFCALVKRHERLVLRVVRRHARGPEEARDLAQRTFLRAFEAARRLLRSTDAREQLAAFPFRAWLVRIALNLGRNHARQARRWPQAPAAVLDERASTCPTALEHLLEDEKRQRLQREVLELPRRQREVLSLRLDAELPFSEIASALGITENNAKVHFHHAVKRLRAALRPEVR